MIFYDQRCLKYLRYEENIRGQSEYPPKFPLLKHLKAIDPSFVTITKLSNDKIGETVCEGLK